MDFSYAINFIFEDRKWLSKLVLLAVITFLSFLIAPLIVALGWMLELAGNVRNGLPRPLPNWTNWGEKLTRGAQIFLAMLLYNLPLLFIGGCSWLLVGVIGGGVIGGGLEVLTFCCALPFALLYTFFAWTMLATGVTEYIETGEAGAMYRFVHLWDVLRANVPVVRRWTLYATLVNMILIVLLIIPCVGWLLIGLFGFPVHGHLLGQFAHQMSLTNAPKPHKKSPKRA